MFNSSIKLLPTKDSMKITPNQHQSHNMITFQLETRKNLIREQEKGWRSQVVSEVVETQAAEKSWWGRRRQLLLVAVWIVAQLLLVGEKKAACCCYGEPTQPAAAGCPRGKVQRWLLPIRGWLSTMAGGGGGATQWRGEERRKEDGAVWGFWNVSKVWSP